MESSFNGTIENKNINTREEKPIQNNSNQSDSLNNNNNNISSLNRIHSDGNLLKRRSQFVDNEKPLFPQLSGLDALFGTDEWSVLRQVLLHLF